MDKKKRDFWKTIGNCCGAKIKYETKMDGTMIHSCRGCGKVLWSSIKLPRIYTATGWTRRSTSIKKLMNDPVSLGLTNQRIEPTKESDEEND